MELGSRSLAAMQEGLKESVNSLAASFGEMLLPAAIEVVGILTSITNAINESPLLKSLLVGALVALTGYLGAMAVKAAVAFANQMALNFAVGALNPVVLAATIAVAGMAGVYVAYAANAQKAKRAQEDLTLAAKRGEYALYDAAAAAQHYADKFRDMSSVEIVQSLRDAHRSVSSLTRMLEDQKNQLENLKPPDPSKWHGEFFAIYQDEYDTKKNALLHSIAEIEQRLAAAKADLDAQRQGKQNVTEEKKPAAPTDDSAAKAAAKAAANWIKQWREQWARFQADIAGDPFAGVEIDLSKKLAEARTHGADRKIIDQINQYYLAERSKVIDQLFEKEAGLTKTKVDDLEYEFQKELEAIDLLEKQRVFAAGESEAEIAAIREQYAAMRQEASDEFGTDLAKTKLDEARASVADWEQAMDDSLTRTMLKFDGFSTQTAVILADLSEQFLNLLPAAVIGGFEDLGRALADASLSSDELWKALGAMAQQILKQLPMMFLQAGLQLIVNGQWPMGLGFIAAAGSTAILSGYVDGVFNATGGVYDRYGRAAAFAAGGVFTNRVVDSPTFFRFASGGGFAPGVMGEAGPEAIMPLRRGPDGKLGVSAGGGQAVYVIIQNYTNEEVKTEESSDGEGNQIRKIIIGAVKESLSSGELDRPLAGRYGLKARGV
jgi:hypothetical protein